MEAICVYCGSSDVSKPRYLDAAREMGVAIHSRGLKLIYGGGSTGMMGAIADSVLSAGGEVIGVVPVNFNTPELTHKGISRLEVVEDINTRKMRMAELSDAFVVLPGGIGTLDEFSETIMWAQVCLHSKPIGLLNVDGFFDALISFLDHVQREGFMYQEHQSLYLCEESPDKLLDVLKEYQPPSGLDHWILRDR
jgi:uncharacterized protein (TIGR00730 family)